MGFFIQLRLNTLAMETSFNLFLQKKLAQKIECEQPVPKGNRR
jgi:hypothetical protein